MRFSEQLGAQLSAGVWRQRSESGWGRSHYEARGPRSSLAGEGFLLTTVKSDDLSAAIRTVRPVLSANSTS